MRKFIARLLRDDEGQDLVEYVLLVSLIALAVAAAFPPVTNAIIGVFNSVGATIGGGGAAGHRRVVASWRGRGAHVVVADRA